MKDIDRPSAADGRESRIRLGGMIASVGLLLYGGMFLTFGITDEDVTEVVGGFGIILVGIGVLVATRGAARRG